VVLTVVIIRGVTFPTPITATKVLFT